jgi:hypothetical protein
VRHEYARHRSQPGYGEARRPGVVDAAEFAIEISVLDIQVRERCDGAGIFVGPIEAGPSQELYVSIVDARGHAKAVQFYFMELLRPQRWFLDRRGKLRRDKPRKRDASALDGLGDRMLDDARHAGTPTP